MAGDGLNHSPLPRSAANRRSRSVRAVFRGQFTEFASPTRGKNPPGWGGASRCRLGCVRLGHCQRISVVHRRLSHNQHKTDHVHRNLICGRLLSSGAPARSSVPVHPHTAVVQSHVTEAVERLRLLCGAVEKPTDSRPARPLCYLAADANFSGRSAVVGHRRIPPHPSRAWVATISTQAPSRAGGTGAALLAA